MFFIFSFLFFFFFFLNRHKHPQLADLKRDFKDGIALHNLLQAVTGFFSFFLLSQYLLVSFFLFSFFLFSLFLIRNPQFTGKKLKKTSKPNTKFQCIANLNICLQFMKEEGFNLVNIGAEGIFFLFFSYSSSYSSYYSIGVYFIIIILFFFPISHSPPSSPPPPPPRPLLRKLHTHHGPHVANYSKISTRSRRKIH